ncbi:C-type lectin domain family 4 member G-like [Archocentrus centrarchus]|uniref:C-type lectin domain family 4 member G-like n=1 Tax=Archocentrus centrarchus TaxID=63155 RepID=UPI0011E9BCAB|nr:C-type lectin domain family 4 member G-like [Archocentrus centrarchus]
MVEEEVNYASVVFKSNKQPGSEVKKWEETVYDEVKVQNRATEQPSDANDKNSDSRCPHYQLLACCLGTLSLILVVGIIAASVYCKYNKLISDNEALKRNQTELRLQIHNLTQASTVLEKHVINLTAEKTNLTQKNEELEAEKKNRTEQIHHMKTSWNELNVSRAQWSIDAYCPKENYNRQCQPCQKGWLAFQSSCYAINDAKTPEQKTWEEARENCRGKISDLVVVIDAAEKKNVIDNSWESSRNKGYWIGLRAEGGKWKWVDGSDLTDDSWIQQPPSDGLCAISVQNQGFESVSCGEKNRWICKKNAVSV